MKSVDFEDKSERLISAVAKSCGEAVPSVDTGRGRGGEEGGAAVAAVEIALRTSAEQAGLDAVPLATPVLAMRAHCLLRILVSLMDVAHREGAPQ